MKILLIGSTEESIANVDLDPSEIPNVINDFDIDEKSLYQQNYAEEPIYLEKIHRRVRMYKLNMFNQPRPGKKLLVLDIDYTLFGMS